MRRFLPHSAPIRIGITAFASTFLPSGSLLGENSPSPSAATKETVALDIQEWPVPWKNTRPRDPDKAPDGSVWFVGQVGNYIARLDPETGNMKRYDVPGAGPHTVIVDDKGQPWYAGNRASHIGRLDPATGNVKKYAMPDGVRDPHSMDWTSNGAIWFTVQRSGEAGYVGRLHPTTGAVEIVTVPGRGMRPYGLVVDANDRPWIAFMGDNAIGTVEPDSMELEIIATPEPESRIRRLALTSDGRVWWTDAARGFVGVYDPADRTMNQWQSPGGKESALYAMAADQRDRIWYVETGQSPNRIIGFDSATEQFVSITEIPSGGGSVRHMIYDPETNALWFGTDTHTIGRARIPDDEAFAHKP